MKNDSFLQKLLALLKQAFSITGKYFSARLLVCLILGIISGIIFKLLDFPLVVLFAVIVGICNIIPMFGPWISAAAVGITLLFFEPIKALYALFIILGTQVLDEFILTPLLLGKAIELKPLTILVVVMLAGAFLGFWGILFALPIAATIKAAYNIFFVAKTESAPEPQTDTNNT